MNNKMQKGFTLIELMIVVAIVGILAAIAIPAYQDYIKRSKTTEVAATIAACKTSVSEFYQANNAWPTSEVQAGCAAAALGGDESQYVNGLTVSTTGTIGATVRNIDAVLNGTVLSMRPCQEAAGGQPAGTCTAPVPSVAATEPLRAWRCFHATTTVHKYLPATCRNAT